MLNGGLPAWVAEGLPLDDTPADEAELAAPVLAASSPPADLHFHACLQARARPPHLPAAPATARHHKRLGLHTGSRKDRPWPSMPLRAPCPWWRRTACSSSVKADILLSPSAGDRFCMCASINHPHGVLQSSMGLDVQGLVRGYGA